MSDPIKDKIKAEAFLNGMRGPQLDLFASMIIAERAQAWNEGWNARESFDPNNPMTGGENPYIPGGGL